MVLRAQRRRELQRLLLQALSEQEAVEYIEQSFVVRFRARQMSPMFVSPYLSGKLACLQPTNFAHVGFPDNIHLANLVGCLTHT